MGKCLGIWLSFRVAGQIIGGAINVSRSPRFLGAADAQLGLNADRNEAGAMNPKIYIVFIALQAAGCFVSPVQDPVLGG